MRTKMNCSDVPKCPSQQSSVESLNVPSKFAIFIRDIPTFSDDFLLRTLLRTLNDQEIFPSLCYSVAKLLKDPQNIMKMKKCGSKREQPANVTICQGCNILVKDLVDHATLRFSPQLLIVDYMCETFVDIGPIVDQLKQNDYEVLFLKRNFEKFAPSMTDTIHALVERIRPFLHNQDLEKIRVDQEVDKWWNESMGVFVDHLPPVHYSRLKKFFAQKEKRGYRSLVSSSLHDHFASPCTQPYGKAAPVWLTKSTKRYCRKMKDVLSYCDYFYEYKEFMKKIKKAEQDNKKWTRRSTLIIIKPEPSKETGKRLIDTLIEKLQDAEISVHIIPIGDLITDSKCARVLRDYNSKLGCSVVEIFQAVIPDIFFHLYDHEDVTVLDCIHEVLVGTKQYIIDAIKRKWKVFILDQSTSFDEKETIRKTVSTLRRRYTESDHWTTLQDI